MEIEESINSIQSQTDQPYKKLKAIELKPSTYLFEQSRLHDYHDLYVFEEAKIQLNLAFPTEESVEEEPIANQVKHSVNQTESMRISKQPQVTYKSCQETPIMSVADQDDDGLYRLDYPNESDTSPLISLQDENQPLACEESSHNSSLELANNVIVSLQSSEQIEIHSLDQSKSVSLQQTIGFTNHVMLRTEDEPSPRVVIQTQTQYWDTN